MSGKNRMHPRNIYKQPPNFKELAIQYPEFRQYVKQDIRGHMNIDYADPKAVKELTRTLLKKDFNLDVDIDESRLIPRVPLCLNYILWVEDLLKTLEEKRTETLGIDIGTGGVCIYSLLAAKKGWKMLATEVDELNYKNAAENLKKNNLENIISLKLVSDSNKLLEGVIDEETKYDFCMCNPPFFKQNEKPKNRTLRRQRMETIPSENPVEISTEGGEISFVKKLFVESEKLQDRIKIYTTLIGKKTDYLYLKKEINNYSPKTVVVTEFCQGKTMRWGLAWSYLDINLRWHSGPPKIKVKKHKTKPPLQFILPKITAEKFDEVIDTTKNLLHGLKIKYNEETCDLGFMVCFKAYENTWSHQRQKKRLLTRHVQSKVEQNSDGSKINENDGQLDDEECSKAKRPKLGSDNTETAQNGDKPLIVEGSMLIKISDSLVICEMVWIAGCKENFYQIFQYLKNHWERNALNSTESG